MAQKRQLDHLSPKDWRNMLRRYDGIEKASSLGPSKATATGAEALEHIVDRGARLIGVRPLLNRTHTLDGRAHGKWMLDLNRLIRFFQRNPSGSKSTCKKRLPNEALL
jgi:hypothetical protein